MIVRTDYVIGMAQLPVSNTGGKSIIRNIAVYALECSDCHCLIQDDFLPATLVDDMAYCKYCAKKLKGK